MNCEECPYREAALRLAKEMLRIGRLLDKEIEKRKRRPYPPVEYVWDWADEGEIEP